MSRLNANDAMRWIAKPLVFLLCLMPAGWLLAGVADLTGFAHWPAASLGANPVDRIQDTLGIWGLRLLLVTLTVTPLRELAAWPRLIAFRRMLGLFAFFYIAAHFAWYLLVDQGLDWRLWVEDIAKRPFITVGFAALVMLVPLALTSTKRAMRRMGRRWQRLHRLIYPAAILGCTHFYWQVKADIREPLVYLLVLAMLLGWRLYRSRQRAGRGRALQDSRKDQDPARARLPVEPLTE
jgi:sulfoxide reductase heme-binding subunit YedZ